MPWSVYCLATVEKPIRSYIGATVDVDRRLAQHNRQLAGGAKATGIREGEWYRVCRVEGFVGQREALSFEWHWKHFSRKQQGDVLEKRRRGLDACLEWCSNKELSVVYE